MMFVKSKTIITFENHKLKTTNVSLKKDGPAIEKEIEREFMPETLAETLTEIKKEFKVSSARILLPEEKTYLKLLEFPRNLGITRDTVLQKAQEVIPDVLEEGYFDWKQAWAKKKNFKVQVLAVSKDYLVPIQQAAQKAKLTLKAFEPPSFALARLTSQEEEPHLIVYRGTKIIICAAREGRAFGVVIVDEESQVDQKAKELTEFVKEKWGLKIKKTISQDLNPAIGLALKEDIKGKDEKVLNLTPPKVEQSSQSLKSTQSPEENMEEESELDQTPSKADFEIRKKMATVSPASGGSPEISQEELSRWEKIREGISQGNKKFVFIGVAITLFFIITIPLTIRLAKKKQEIRKKAAQPSPAVSLSPIPTETPQPSPASEPKREDLKIQVLNGSGIAGAAGTTKEFLEGLGYKDIEAGNADSYDYQETEISIKESKRDYLDLLKEDLFEEYTLSIQTPYVDKENKFDVIITIGKK